MELMPSSTASLTILAISVGGIFGHRPQGAVPSVKVVTDALVRPRTRCFRSPVRVAGAVSALSAPQLLRAAFAPKNTPPARRPLCDTNARRERLVWEWFDMGGISSLAVELTWCIQAVNCRYELFLRVARSLARVPT